MIQQYKAKIEVREADERYIARVDLRLNRNITSALLIDAPVRLDSGRAIFDFSNSHYSVGGDRFPYEMRRGLAGVLNELVSHSQKSIAAGLKKDVPFSRVFAFEANDGRTCCSERGAGVKTSKSYPVRSLASRKD